MTLATEQGRTAALEALRARRAANKDKPWVDNSRLPAGSPMYFRCIGCGADIVVPENWLYKPSSCPECQALAELGWME
jgi:hypothetical protein